jgi:6-phosphogluconate dehydrogenase
MSMATAQPTLALHTQQFVDSLAGAPPIYTLSPGGAQSLLGPGTVQPGRQARCAIPKHYQYDLNLPDITEVWRRGSVVASWLLDLSAAALLENPDLSNFAGRVSDSGEGRWTIKAAIDEGVPANVLSAALYERFSSRGEAEFADKLLSAMRYEFGGHIEKPAKS